MTVAALRAHAQRRFLAVWTQRADVSRPDGVPTFDAGPPPSYTDPVTTVTTGMACSLTSRSVETTVVDVAGDTQTQTRVELRYDPAVRLQVDDRVTFTVHDDAGLVGTVWYVVEVGEAYEHVYGLATVQRTAPDSGA